MPTQPDHVVDLAAMAAIDAAAIAGAKQTLRKAILFRRDARTNEQRDHDDESRMAMIESSLEDRIPDTVAAYLSSGSEPGTLQLVAWLAANSVRVLLPVLSHPGHRTRGPMHCVLGRTQSWNRQASRCRASSCPRQS